MKAQQVQEWAASLDPEEDVLWQAFTRSDIESMTSKEITDDLWDMMVQVYDKEPATAEDFQIDIIIEVAEERLAS